MTVSVQIWLNYASQSSKPIRVIRIGIIRRVATRRWVKTIVGILLGWVMFSLLTSCANVPTPTRPPTTATVVKQLTLYPKMSSTVHPRQEASRTLTIPTFVPAATATPYLYTIVEGDTLLAIGSRFGVSLEDILRVNPGIDPRLLSVGEALVIPIGGQDFSALPSPTPVPLTLLETRCYPLADTTVWCVLLVKNDQSQPLEGVTAQVSLYTSDGKVFATRQALSLLNVIQAGKSVPLVAHFTELAPGEAVGAGQLKTAFLLSSQTDRYLPTSIDRLKIDIDSRGQRATVNGRVAVSPVPDSLGAVLVKVALVAYGQDEAVIGVRWWERELDGWVEGGVPFSEQVFSLGPPIFRVDALSEVQVLKDEEQ